MDFGINFFKIDKKYHVPSKGKVLIAEPFLNDSYFKRSIVLLTEHNKEGTIGFVLNKPVTLKLDEIVPDLPTIKTDVSIGGPVGTNSIHYIHTLGDLIPNSTHVFGNISWGGDFDFVKGMLQSDTADISKIKFFLGYSGWQPDQLENELKEDSWIVTDLNPAMIMLHDTKNLWKKALSMLGKKYEIWSNFPEDPGLN